MLKYKMTVPHVQLKYKKMYFSFISISFAKNTGENASYLSLCLCVSIVRRKIKCKISFNFKVKWCLVAARLRVFCLQYRNASPFLSLLLTSRGDGSCMGTSLLRFTL